MFQEGMPPERSPAPPAKEEKEKVSQTREQLERNAGREIAETFRERLEKELRLLKDNPVVQIRGKPERITGSADVAVALGQTYRRVMGEILEAQVERSTAEGLDNDALREAAHLERAAAKFSELFEIADQLRQRCVELALYYPEAAAVLMHYVPELGAVIEQGDREWKERTW